MGSDIRASSFVHHHSQSPYRDQKLATASAAITSIAARLGLSPTRVEEVLCMANSATGGNLASPGTAFLPALAAAASFPPHPASPSPHPAPPPLPPPTRRRLLLPSRPAAASFPPHPSSPSPHPAPPPLPPPRAGASSFPPHQPPPPPSLPTPHPATGVCAMLRHLRSTAASASSHSPPPPPSPAPTEDDNEENARAIAVSDQRTIYLVNMFIANTVEFLNSFAALCNDKLALLHRKIVKLDSSLTLLETKLHSIDDTNALGHSTSQKAQQCFTHEERFDPANLFGESSSM